MIMLARVELPCTPTFVDLFCGDDGSLADPKPKNKAVFKIAIFRGPLKKERRPGNG
jgi:hypothetical protein